MYVTLYGHSWLLTFVIFQPKVIGKGPNYYRNYRQHPIIMHAPDLLYPTLITFTAKVL